jgi:hypothetical protein
MSHFQTLRYLPGICLVGLRKTAKAVCQDSWSLAET